MSTPTVPTAPPIPDVPGVEHHVVETPGLLTHLAVVGDGDPVLMLHGFPQHWWEWRDIAPRLAASGHRVLCPDLRGSGWTVAEDQTVRRETRMNDVLALLDALHLESVHLVSHDLGSVTAMQLSYAHPLRITTAVQLSVPPGFMTFSPRTLPGFGHLPSFIWHRPGASMRGVFCERYVARPMSEETIATHLAPFRIPEIDGAVRTLIRGMLLPEGLRMTSGVYRRQRLTVPTLFAFGRQDRYWNEEIMGLVCRDPENHADRAEFAYVDGASHFIADDAPAAVADLVLDWWARAA